jgi:hypothetical protein
MKIEEKTKDEKEEKEEKEEKTMLSIRLFDGTQLKCNYPVDAKLSGVMKYVRKLNYYNIR